MVTPALKRGLKPTGLAGVSVGGSGWGSGIVASTDACSDSSSLTGGISFAAGISSACLGGADALNLGLKPTAGLTISVVASGDGAASMGFSAPGSANVDDVSAAGISSTCFGGVAALNLGLKPTAGLAGSAAVSDGAVSADSAAIGSGSTAGLSSTCFGGEAALNLGLKPTAGLAASVLASDDAVVSADFSATGSAGTEVISVVGVSSTGFGGAVALNLGLNPVAGFGASDALSANGVASAGFSVTGSAGAEAGWAGVAALKRGLKPGEAAG